MNPVDEYLALAKDKYTLGELLAMERRIVNTLGFKLHVPNLESHLSECTALWDCFIVESSLVSSH